LELVRRGQVAVAFEFSREQGSVLQLMKRYADLPMGFADACLVRMAETQPEPVVLTTDAHFRIYRRHSRQIVPCVLPR
jgi:predicted nucleic acid-binding protein